MKTSLPAAEFEDFVEGSDCKGDSIVDEDAASPSGWGVVGASYEDPGGPCAEAYPVSFLLDPLAHEEAHEGHNLEVAYPAAYLLDP